IKVYSGGAGFAKLTTNGVVSAQATMQAGDISAAMITGQTEKAVTVDPEDQFLMVDKVTGLLRMVKAKWFSRLAPNFLSGFTMSNGTDTVNDINVGPGACPDSTNSADIVLSGTLSKRVDAAWAAGTNVGGRDTGAIAAAWWHVFVIMNPARIVVDVLMSQSLASPVLPGGFTLKRRIGSVHRWVAQFSGIRAFVQMGDFFQYS